MEETISKHSPLTYFLGVVVFVFVINFVADWQNKSANTRYKQNRVDDYNSFYSDCKDYFTDNKTVQESRIDDTCKSLEKFSKDESKEVIYDLEYPTKDE